MANMQKLKADALKRKHEHDEKQRQEELRKLKSGRPRQSRDRERPAGRNARGRNNAAPTQAPVHRKPKKTPTRWVVDILLVLGALMLLVMMFNPYG